MGIGWASLGKSRSSPSRILREENVELTRRPWPLGACESHPWLSSASWGAVTPVAARHDEEASLQEVFQLKCCGIRFLIESRKTNTMFALLEVDGALQVVYHGGHDGQSWCELRSITCLNTNTTTTTTTIAPSTTSTTTTTGQPTVLVRSPWLNVAEGGRCNVHTCTITDRNRGDPNAGVATLKRGGGPLHMPVDPPTCL